MTREQLFTGASSARSPQLSGLGLILLVACLCSPSVLQAADQFGLTNFNEACKAIERDQLDKLEELLRIEPSLATRTNFGKDAWLNDPLLHIAAYGRGSTQAMSLLIKYGSPVDIRSVLRQTPLHVAAGFGWFTKTAEFLIQHGADVNAVCATDETPLQFAIQENHSKNFDIETLLAHGARIDRHSLRDAITHRRPDALRKQLEHGANPNTIWVRGTTLLHLAVEYRNFEAVQLLVQYKASINATNEDGETPLDWVAKDFYGLPMPKMIEFLREHGAVSKNPKGPTIAAVLGDVGVLQKYIRKYPDLPTKEWSMHGERILHYAVFGGKTSTVDCLLTNGAAVDWKNDANVTALHYAVEAGYPKVVALLLRHGANPGAKRKDGQTPLSLAIEGKNEEIISLLRDKARD